MGATDSDKREDNGNAKKSVFELMLSCLDHASDFIRVLTEKTKGGWYH